MPETTQQAQVGSAQEPGSEPVATTEERLAAAEARATEHWAAYLRVAAELDNFRKRMSRELESTRQYAIERFAAEILPVADSLGLGLDAATTADLATLTEGHRATLRQLQKAFADAGITEIDPIGKPFDPQLHEAMTTQQSDDKPPDTVLLVAQKGYLLNGRLLRPARVVVSAAPTPSTDG